MAECEIGQVILCLATLGVCLGSFADDVGEFFVSVKDENTKSLNRASHLHCFMECIIRKPCVFISSTYLESVIARQRPYRCHLYLSNKTETTGVQKTCEHHNLPTRVLPQAIAGACSDHKCPKYKRCLPLPGGSSWCKPDKGRGNKRKAKGRKERTTKQ